jgi:hypothetical protein
MESKASERGAVVDELTVDRPDDSALRQVSRRKLEELLGHKCEADTLDYKERVDLSDTASRVELSKDILAMANTKGGHIVIGVEDETWKLVGVEERSLAHFRGGASVMEKIGKYCGAQIIVHCGKHQMDGLWIVLLYVPGSKQPVLAAADGSYQDPDNPRKTKCSFTKGDFFVRKSDSSVKLTDATYLQNRFAQSPLSGSAVSTKRRKSSHRVGSPKPAIDNPYDFTNIAKRELFKGRREEISQLIENIRSGTHTAVFGLQRMGKTSLVEHVMKEELPQREELRNSTIYAKIDFQRTTHSRYRDLFDLFLNAIVSQFRSDQLRARAEYHIAAFTSKATQPSLTNRRLLFEPFAATLKELVELTHGRRIVLFLDEFSEWCRVIENNEGTRKGIRSSKSQALHESLVDVDLMQFFSSLMRDQAFKSRLVFVFAVRPFMAEYDSQKNLQILKLADPITLYYLDKCSAISLITEPLRGKVRIEEDAADHLYESTAGHPYLIQFILKKVVDKCSTEGLQVVTKELVIYQESYMTREGPAYDAHFRILDSDYSTQEVLSTSGDALGKGLLSLIAKLGSDGEKGWVTHDEVRAQMKQRGCSQNQTDKLLDQLVRAKILEECPIQEALCFRMVIPLLRKRYVQQNFFLKHFSGSETYGGSAVPTVAKPGRR